MAILTDRSLKNFARQIPLRNVLYFIEMACGTIIGSSKVLRLRGRMDKIFFGIGMGP